MGVATAVIYTRPAAGITPQLFCNSANNFLAALVEAGMVPVSDSDFVGQSKSFVVAATADPKDTVVAPISTGLRGRALVGYAVFRHPHKNYYIKLNLGYEAESSYHSTTIGSRMYVSLNLATSLNGTGGFGGAPIELLTKSIVLAYDNSYPNTVLIAKPLTLRISVGLNHFTCCASFDFTGYSSIASQFNNKTGFSSVAFAVIGSKLNPRYSVVFYPRTMGFNTSYPEESSMSLLSELNCQLQRKYILDHQGGTFSYIGAGQTVQAMSEVGLVSDINGVRVAQPYITIDGQMLPLEMGCIHAGATEDMGILTVDIDGNGPKQYYAPFGMGPSNFVPWDQPLVRIPIFIFPYY